MLRDVRIRQEADRVLLIADGKLIASLPWQAALELANAVHTQAKRAEEYAKRDQLIFDQGLLHRLGVRLGLIHDPTIRREAECAARHDTRLRRSVPGGVKSQESVGAPHVIRHLASADTGG